MKYLTMMFLLFFIFPVVGEITGDVSIGKDRDIAKGNMKIGYDFEIGEVIIIPFFEYTNFFYIDGLSGKPFKDIFKTGLKAEYSDFYLLIYHECIHPVSYEYDNTGNPILEEDAQRLKTSNYIIIGYRWGKRF